MEAVEQGPSGIVTPETLKEAQQQGNIQTENREGGGVDKESESGKETNGEADGTVPTVGPPAVNGSENGTLDGKDDDDTDVKDAPTQRPLAQAPLVCPETSSATASPRHDQPTQEYHLKWVDWNKRRTPIVTQNENGPCPLIAILNVLLLRAVIEIPEGVEIVTATQLFNYLGNTILQRIPEDATEAVRKNFEKNMSDAMEIVSKLQTGLDVNVRFTGVSDFEYTQECLIFDLLNISLYHGWLYDPQNIELISAIGTCSYNQLVENIIESKNSSEEVEVRQEVSITWRESDTSRSALHKDLQTTDDLVAFIHPPCDPSTCILQQDNLQIKFQPTSLVAESFLQSSAAQLTYHGLCELNSTIKNNQLCVLFRNNHFSTLCKHDDILYILVTDQGFLTASNVVWESLSNVEGDSLFYDGAFQRCQPDIKPEAPPSMSMEQQIDSDLLLALSMQEDQKSSSVTGATEQDGPLVDTSITDQELAMKLQAEEDLQAAQRVQEQEEAAAAAAAAGGQQGQQRPAAATANGAMANPPAAGAQQQRPGRREQKEKSCVII